MKDGERREIFESPEVMKSDEEESAQKIPTSGQITKLASKVKEYPPANDDSSGSLIAMYKR